MNRHSIVPTWIKQTIAIGSTLVALAGILPGLGLLCFVLLSIEDGGTDATRAGLFIFGLLALTVGAGSVGAWHMLASLQRNRSNSLKLPPAWLLMLYLALWIGLGIFLFEENEWLSFLLLPVLVGAAALPSLAAVAWFNQNRPFPITWRWGTMAFIGGATVSVGLTVATQLLLTLTIAAPLTSIPAALEHSFSLLSTGFGRAIVSASGSDWEPRFQFFHLVIAAPLIAELVKPLVLWPVLKQLSRRQTFLLGALVGAGFAAVENLIYLGLGFEWWPGLLLLLALGGALHPLTTGLIALGWRELRQGQPAGGITWLARFGSGAAIHMLWNLGLAGTELNFDPLPFLALPGLGFGLRQLRFLFLLLGLGAVGLWLGRLVVKGAIIFIPSKSAHHRFTPTHQALAIWAVASLGAIVSVGIISLQLWMR